MNWIQSIFKPPPSVLRIELTPRGLEISVISSDWYNPTCVSYELVLGLSAFSEAIYWLLLNGHINPSQPIISKVEIESTNNTALLLLKTALMNHLLSTSMAQIL